MTKGYTVKNNLHVKIGDNQFTVANGRDFNGNSNLVVTGNDVKTVDLQVVAQKSVSKEEVSQLLATGGDVNKTFFNKAFTTVAHVDTRRISTGGGHNDATTYDDHRLMLVVHGVITVKKAVAKKIIEHDKEVLRTRREVTDLQEQVRELQKKVTETNTLAYRTERKVFEV